MSPGTLKATAAVIEEIENRDILPTGVSTIRKVADFDEEGVFSAVDLKNIIPQNVLADRFQNRGGSTFHSFYALTPALQSPESLTFELRRIIQPW